MVILGESGPWTMVEECRGYGTDQYGCGKKLLIQEADLHIFPGAVRVANLVSFTCPSCRTENLAVGLPQAVKDRVFSRTLTTV